MHITLTDRLTCPRCGPGTGLIVLMDEVADRRVVRGSLGCPACRQRYAIEGRVADLRAGGGEVGGEAGGEGNGRARARAGARARGPATETEAETDDGVVRVAALLGLADGSGFLVVDGPEALSVGLGLREYAPDYEAVVVVDPLMAAEAGAADVSGLMVEGGLPMADSLMRAAAYVGGAPGEARLRELVRVVRPTGRVVVDGAEAGELEAVARLLVELGAQVRARDENGLVAVVM